MINLTYSTDHYTIDYFCELTKSTYDIEDHYFDPVKASSDSWAKLADLWSEFSKDCGTYVFHDAVSHIKYGHDLQEFTVTHQALVQAVCLEICSDSHAGCVWRQHPFFKCALEEDDTESDADFFCRLFSKEGLSVSLEHCHYLANRMMLRYWLAEGVLPNQCSTASNYISAYENFIAKLCPSAADWASDYWIDVDHIFSVLLHECGFDYRNNHREYDILISLFRMETFPYSLTCDKDLDILRCVCNLNHFSLHGARVLWPSNTESTLIKQYYLAERRAKELSLGRGIEEDILRPCYVLDISQYTFVRSWLYSVVQHWINTGELHTRYEKERLKAMFEIGLGI